MTLNFFCVHLGLQAYAATPGLNKSSKSKGSTLKPWEVAVAKPLGGGGTLKPWEMVP